MFTLTVNAVNDVPILTLIGDQVTDEDTDFTIDLSALDVDIDENNQTLTFSAVSSDDAPVLDEIGSQVTNEDIPLSLSLSADDIDGDELSFNAFSEYPDFVSVFLAGNELTLTPAEDFYGDVQINVSVTDSEYSDTEVFTLTVTPVNDAPTIDLPESITFPESGSVVEDFSVYIDDIDEDALTLTSSGNENVIVSIDGFVVTFSSVESWNGTETVIFTVDDLQGRAVASDSIDVTVTPVNDFPVLWEIDDQTTPEEVVLAIPIYASDIDGDVLDVTAVSDSPGDVSIEVEMVGLRVTNFDGSEDSIGADVDDDGDMNVFSESENDDRIDWNERLPPRSYQSILSSFSDSENTFISPSSSTSAPIESSLPSKFVTLKPTISTSILTSPGLSLTAVTSKTSPSISEA
jgi:hypothetical protein